MSSVNQWAASKAPEQRAAAAAVCVRGGVDGGRAGQQCVLIYRPLVHLAPPGVRHRGGPGAEGFMGAQDVTFGLRDVLRRGSLLPPLAKESVSPLVSRFSSGLACTSVLELRVCVFHWTLRLPVHQFTSLCFKSHYIEK